MYKTGIFSVLAILIALALPEEVWGQVPVKVSSQRIVTGGKVYYMHHVLKGQTLYSISRAYMVSIDAITGANVISKYGIQTDQILKIPESEALAVSRKPQTQQQTQPQAQPQPQSQVQPKSLPQQQPQAQQSVQQQAPPSAKPQQQTEPKTQQEVQPQSQQQTKPVAKTPVKKPVRADGNLSHKVKKGESISSIARKYGISERELRKANKGLLFPMPGMYLVIPVKLEEEADTLKRE
ncbi:MAG TPA: LysM peptidoglycan-binding domain-containing protein [Bacteroidales bacterium]|nr:LysM peptidoglycan-binding domain-containing protein [Bacteroidales bacterium]